MAYHVRGDVLCICVSTGVNWSRHESKGAAVFSRPARSSMHEPVTQQHDFLVLVSPSRFLSSIQLADHEDGLKCLVFFFATGWNVPLHQCSSEIRVPAADSQGNESREYMS